MEVLVALADACLGSNFFEAIKRLTTFGAKRAMRYL
jgi:hypothetical protein